MRLVFRNNISCVGVLYQLDQPYIQIEGDGLPLNTFLFYKQNYFVHAIIEYLRLAYLCTVLG